MRKWNIPGAMLVMAASLIFVVGARAAESKPEKRPDYLNVVKAYADTLIARGRDTYGNVHSPLFAVALDRKKLTIEGVKSPASVRVEDSSVGGANPMHDQNLYQILYALTEITGQQKYAAEADKALKYFFEHCQHPTSGLMAWGEHMCWDLTKDAVKSQGYADPYHEYTRPWVLWERCFKLAPEPCDRFAKGLWKHQIHDQETGDYNRHAFFDGKRHSEWRGRRDGYPRHGGFYIRTWAEAYRATKDPVYLKALETLVEHFNRRRGPYKGPLTGTDALPMMQKRYTVWWISNLSLAVDLGYGGELVTDEVAKKMRDCASRTDTMFLSKGLTEDGMICNYSKTKTVQKPEFLSGSWLANHGMERFRQVGLDGYRKFVLLVGNLGIGTELPEKDLHLRTVGDVIWLLAACHELTGDEKYLRQADLLAARAIELFLTDGSPLPRMSTQDDHYEAVTCGDSMMLSLLKLWLAENKPDLKVNLVYADR